MARPRDTRVSRITAVHYSLFGPTLRFTAAVANFCLRHRGVEREERVAGERLVDDHADDAHHGGAAVVALRVELELLHRGVVVPGQWADRPAQSCLSPCAAQQRLAARSRCCACSTTRPSHRTPWGRDGARLSRRPASRRHGTSTAGAAQGGCAQRPARQLLRQAAHLTQVMPPTSPGSLDGSVAP